jgi:hypothetical protein
MYNPFKEKKKMSEFVTVNLAIQGEPVKPIEIPVNSTLAEVRVLKNLRSDLEFRIQGEEVEDDFHFTEDEAGVYLIGTRDAKGGIA